MQDQTTAHVAAVIGASHAEGLAGRVLDEGPEVADLGQHPVATLSAPAAFPA